jgi:DNA-binding FrmR family transcriptional regulator
MSEEQKEARRRLRLVEGLDRMVASGRVTEEEAARLRASGVSGEFDAVVREIRVRHATPKLVAAVEGGNMTQAEADAAVEALRAGEHSGSLRARLHGLLSSGSRH